MTETTYRRFFPKNKLVFAALLLAVAAIVAEGVAYWYGQKVDSLRQRYRDQGNTIDIPEAIYFDSMAASVILPAHLICFVLQWTSAALFCLNWQGSGYFLGTAYWIIWFMAWGFCLGWTGLFDPVLPAWGICLD